MVALCLILSADIIIQVHGGSFNDRSISLQNLGGGGNNLRRCDLSGARRIRRSSSASKMISSPSSSTSSSIDDSAFIFILLKGRKRKANTDSSSGQIVEQQEYLGDTTPIPIVNGDSLIKNGRAINGDTQQHSHYNLGTKANGQQYNHQSHETQLNQLLDIDIIEDEPYPSNVHPIQNAYNNLSSKLVRTKKEIDKDKVPELLETLEDVESSSLDSLEGTSDKTEINDSQIQSINGYHIEEDIKEEQEVSSSASPKNMWSKRNARSIDEGIRFSKTQLRDRLLSIDTTIQKTVNGDRTRGKGGFKSQLRDGLEEQGAQHRKRMLNDLLEGVMGGTTNAIEKVQQQAQSKNGTNPFRWLGFGRKDSNVTKVKGSTRGDIDDSNFHEVLAADTSDLEPSKKDNKKETKSKNRQFGARTIAGLIMALAEEVEGLEVEIDADPNTPIWDKSVNSIKIYFSRLGFRQLRMGGLDEVVSDLEASMSPSERFALASSFIKNMTVGGGKTPTADEAFDRIDTDKSGSLDEEELAEALKMAAFIGGNAKFGMRSKKETLTELASRLVKLYDTNGDGVVDREEYQAMVQDMAALREARLREELHENEEDDLETTLRHNGEKRRRWFTNVFGGSGNRNTTQSNNDAPIISSTTGDDSSSEIIDITENEEFWSAVDQGEGSIVLEDLKLDLRRLLFGAIPGAKRVSNIWFSACSSTDTLLSLYYAYDYDLHSHFSQILPGGPLVLKPFTATLTASFTPDDLMDSFLLDSGLRRLAARALSRRVRGIRDLLDGAVFYGRTWKAEKQDAPLVEVAKLEDVHFDFRNRLVITGRAKIQEALGYKHEAIEQGFKLRCRIGTRANGRIIGLVKPEIAIFAEWPKDWERNVRAKVKEWFDYTIPTAYTKPLYTYIPLVSPLKKSDKMDGFNMGEDNQIKQIYVENGKLRFEMSSFIRPGRFLGNHYVAFTFPNRTLILTLGRVKDAIRNARRNKRLAELAAREVQKQAAETAAQQGKDVDLVLQTNLGKRFLSPEGKVRIRRLENELKLNTMIYQRELREEAILREIDSESSNKGNGKSFISRFVEGYSGAIREELDLEMNARLSSSISDFFGSQDGNSENGEEKEDTTNS